MAGAARRGARGGGMRARRRRRGGRALAAGRPPLGAVRPLPVAARHPGRRRRDHRPRRHAERSTGRRQPNGPPAGLVAHDPRHRRGGHPLQPRAPGGRRAEDADRGAGDRPGRSRPTGHGTGWPTWTAIAAGGAVAIAALAARAGHPDGPHRGALRHRMPTARCAPSSTPWPTSASPAMPGRGHRLVPPPARRPGRRRGGRRDAEAPFEHVTRALSTSACDRSHCAT